MNACERHQPHLVDAAEGRRTPRLDLHLATCEPCRTRLEHLKADLATLAPDPAPAPGPWLAGRIRARAEARRTLRTRLSLALGGLTAVTATVFIALGWPAPGGPDGPVPTAAWDEVLGVLEAGPYGLGDASLPATATLQDLESGTYRLDTLDPDHFDPFAPALGLDLEAEVATASDAELAALLAHLPG